MLFAINFVKVYTSWQSIKKWQSAKLKFHIQRFKSEFGPFDNSLHILLLSLSYGGPVRNNLPIDYLS